MLAKQLPWNSHNHGSVEDDPSLKTKLLDFGFGHVFH